MVFKNNIKTKKWMKLVEISRVPKILKKINKRLFEDNVTNKIQTWDVEALSHMLPTELWYKIIIEWFKSMLKCFIFI
jgi:hypothetical protein